MENGFYPMQLSRALIVWRLTSKMDVSRIFHHHLAQAATKGYTSSSSKHSEGKRLDCREQWLHLDASFTGNGYYITQDTQCSQAAFVQKMPKSALFVTRNPKIWAREDLLPVQSLTLPDGEPPKILENPKISDIRFIRHQRCGFHSKNNFLCKNNQKSAILGVFRGFVHIFAKTRDDFSKIHN